MTLKQLRKLIMKSLAGEPKYSDKEVKRMIDKLPEMLFGEKAQGGEDL